MEALCELGVPVIDDVGSGWLAGQPTLTGGEAAEPDLTDSVAGAARGDAGIELPAVTTAARALAAADTLGWEAAFLRAVARGRPAWRARVAQWRDVEAVLAALMDRITLGGAEPGRAAHATARELDRLLGATR